MNDRKFSVRKSRKSTKKGGNKNGTATKEDVFDGYKVDPVEESNQKIAMIMNEMMQAEAMNNEEEKTDLNTTFAYEDKVNQEEFKDLIAKT